LAASFLSKLAVENLGKLTSTFFAWEHRLTVQKNENDICLFYLQSQGLAGVFCFQMDDVNKERSGVFIVCGKPVGGFISHHFWGWAVTSQEQAIP